MRLVIVRHAEAAPGEPDELRSLTAQGREQARALGELFRAVGIEPDVVLTSPLLRAQETASALQLGAPEVDERLAPGASPEDVRDAAWGRGETVLVVGHQPDCGRAVLALSGREALFPPAGYADLQL
jgi:phosphohistidine phosphatase